MGFYVAYQLVRGAADRDVAGAFHNGEWVIRTQQHLGALFEPTVQRFVDSGRLTVPIVVGLRFRFK